MSEAIILQFLRGLCSRKSDVEKGLAKKKSFQLCVDELSLKMKLPDASVEKKKYSSLLHNLRAEYVKVNKIGNASGAATEEKKIRKSAEIFLAFEEYHTLYYPGGSSAKPVMLVEPGKKTGYSAHSDSEASTVGSVGSPSGSITPTPSMPSGSMMPSTHTTSIEDLRRMVLEEQLKAFRSMREYFDAKKARMESPISPLEEILFSHEDQENLLTMPTGPQATEVPDD